MKTIVRKLIYSVCAVVMIIGFFYILYLPVQPSGQILNSGWTINTSEDQIQFPYNQPITEITSIAFHNTFHYSSGDALILTWMKGQAVKVLLNDQLIFSMGNPEEPTANIWNSTFLIQLPEPKAEMNDLEIQLSSASYPINISIPPYLMELEKAEEKVAIIKFLYEDLLLISIGGSILVGFILILLSLILKKSWTPEVLLGLATIFGAIECFDYALRISTGNLALFFLLKKILTIAGYLSALCFVIGTEKYYRGKIRISKYLAMPTILSILIIASASDLIVFSKTLSLLNIILLIDLIIAVALILKGGRGRDWLLIPAIWLVLGLMQMLAVQCFRLPWPYVIQYILLMSTVLLGFNLIIDFNRVYIEKMDLEKRIDLDTLTTAYNRNVLDKASQKQYDVLILMDLDNFKSYNDKHGHQQGDKLLIEFAEIIKRNLRPTDLVVRYGGDEFLLLLGDVGIIDAEQIALRIRLQFEETTLEDALSVSYGIEKIKHSLDSDLNKADRLMYAMKQAKQLQKKDGKHHR